MQKEPPPREKLLRICFLLKCRLTAAANGVPLTVSADLRQKCPVKNMSMHCVTKRLPGHFLPRQQTAAVQHRRIIPPHLLCRVTHMGLIVGTAGTDTVLPHRQRDLRIFPVKPCNLLCQVPGKCSAVAVAAEKRGTQAMMRPEFNHCSVPDASESALPEGLPAQSLRSPAK